MNKKMLNMLWLCLFIIMIYFTPNFLNFMEKQTNILNINVPNNVIGNIPITTIKCNQIKQDLGVKLPKNIQEEMETRIQHEQEIAKLKELEKQKEIERQKQIKIANENKSSFSKPTTRSIETPRTNDYVAYVATGYCPCAKCCGKNTGITASGAKAQAGVTVAMPSRFKFGTKIEIKGMGKYIVQDRGGAIKGNKIDIYFNTHQEALNFGRRTVYLKILQD